MLVHHGAEQLRQQRLRARAPGRCTYSQPIGLRFCGMVELPPLPGAAGSLASATSDCISQHHVVGGLGQRAAQHARTSSRAPRCRRAPTCQGMAGQGEVEFLRRAPPRRAGPSAPSEASVPTAPPNCSRSTRGRSCASRSRMVIERIEPERDLVAEGDGQGLLRMGAARPSRCARCAWASAAKRGDQPVEVGARAARAPRAAAAPGRCRGCPAWWRPNASSALPPAPPRPKAASPGRPSGSPCCAWRRPARACRADRDAARRAVMACGGLRRDQPEPRLGAGQRRLDLEHARRGRRARP